MKKFLFIAFMLAGVVSAQAQTYTIFNMQIIADNDFAILGGSSTHVHDLIYQNDYSWPDQLSNLQTLNFYLPDGDNTIYVLGLGGGGTENISGTVNGIDITTIPVQASSDIGSYLTDFENQNGSDPNAPSNEVADGTFDVKLADVQTALNSGTVTFSDASSDINYSDYVITQSPNGVGYDFPSSTAVLFVFGASEVGITAVPEPSTFVLLGLAFAGLLVAGRKKAAALVSL